jgi:serine phosphatase RsbU (regulator of sigma subunit)
VYDMWTSQIPGVVAVPQTHDVRGGSKHCEHAELVAPFCAEDQPERIQALVEELAGVRREQAAIQRSLFEAAQIQRRLCAPRQLDSQGFQVAGEIFPVRHLSGDFFKVFELGSSLGIVVGDIAGKGLSAGIWMPHLLSLIYSCALAHPDPENAIAAVNRELCSGCGDPPLAAVFFARLDETTGEIAYCNAGLPSPLILKGNNAVVSLESGGPMLGAVPTATFQAGTAMMENGETLIACSDGVTECEDSREHEFGSAGLLKAARADRGSSAIHTLFSTLGAVLDFADGQALRDDLTLLVVQRATASGAGEKPLRAAPILH